MKLLLFTSYRGWSHGRRWLEYLGTRHDVHVATFKDFGERIPGVTVHALLGNVEARQPSGTQSAEPDRSTPWLTMRIGLRFARKFGCLIDELQPDLVHAHQSIPFGWYALRAVRASKLKPRLIVSVWGSDVLAFPERYPLYGWMNRRVLDGADSVTATGKFLRSAAYRWTDRRDIMLVPFGVDTSRFTPKARVADHPHIFGMVKQLKAELYGLEMAIAALALARKKDDSLRLELAGDGPARQSLERLAASLGVADVVRFLGAIPTDELPPIWQFWDVHLLPSRQESFGVAALEAQACGLPVLAARTGGIPEVVRESVTARFVEPLDAEHLAQAMLALVNDRALLESARREGPTWVHQAYEWSDSCRRMEKVYAA